MEDTSEIRDSIVREHNVDAEPSGDMEDISEIRGEMNGDNSETNRSVGTDPEEIEPRRNPQ